MGWCLFTYEQVNMQNNLNEWQDRWKNQQIGWHQDEISPLLKSYFNTVKLIAGATIFVPLCGKSLDINWFVQQGFSVIGVEISDIAIQAFFEEAGLKAEKKEIAGLICWQAEQIQIYQADFFALTATHLNTISLVFDRAALIALADSEQRGRKAYIQHLNTILPAATAILLITLDYPQEQMSGPPFAVSDREVKQLFNTKKIQLLSTQSILEQEPRFKARGLDALTEQLYLITET